MIEPFGILQASLLDLLYELRETEIKLIVGGGYGIYLKRQYVLGAGIRTMLETFPQARSTNDLDIFLQTEILASPEQLKQIIAVLDRLGYVVVETAKYYQFANARNVKIDLLTRYPPPSFLNDKKIRVDDRRVKSAKKGTLLQAHSTQEAIAIEDNPLEVSLFGPRTTREDYTATLFLPQAFAYAMMKLFAFRDRSEDKTKDYGRHHALDLYSIIAMMTQAEYEIALQLRQNYHDEPTYQEAIGIVQTYFSTGETLGTLRLREHPDYSPDMDVETFLSVLTEIF